MKPRFADRVHIPKPWNRETDVAETFKRAGWTPPSEEIPWGSPCPTPEPIEYTPEQLRELEKYS